LAVELYEKYRFNRAIIGSISSLLALIPQPFLPVGEGEQDFKVPLRQGEGFRVRAVRSLAKVTYSRNNSANLDKIGSH
jgi:hypothetical protein